MLKFYLFDVLSWWYILLPLPLSHPKTKIGKPKEEIGNLNGFEFMYLSDIKVPYF
jgi:hypothetical protein